MGEDALEELRTSFIATSFAACDFRFDRDQTSFDGSIEYGRFVTLRAYRDSLENVDGVVKAGEMLFDLSDYPALLFFSWQREIVRGKLLEVDSRTIARV
ncbi:MAG: hypothetical protein A3G83_12435 [Betaproteobacteria bacterium RIFCSPLOWO2_12_FULL_68_20]|nr:MAG: hypothetical protein A3G83_12435 [Betaproteobacteria bacterium RIFCSPLOWO2_12_FULL_68_20]